MGGGQTGYIPHTHTHYLLQPTPYPEHHQHTPQPPITTSLPSHYPPPFSHPPFFQHQHPPQETPDEIPEGETPTSLTLFAYDDLTDAVRPGDRIEVTGILRAAPRRIHPRLTTVRCVLVLYALVRSCVRAGCMSPVGGRARNAYSALSHPSRPSSITAHTAQCIRHTWRRCTARTSTRTSRWEARHVPQCDKWSCLQ